MSFVLIFALLLSNITTSLVGVTLTPLLGKLTTLRIDRIVLPVLIASLVTLIQLNGSIVDLYVAAGFGVLGYLFRHFDWPRIPFVIAFVLGDFIEDNLAMTVKLADAGRIDLSARPAAWVMLLVILLTLGWMLKRMVRSEAAPRRVSAEGAFALAMAAIPAVMAGMAFWQGYTTLSSVMALLAAGLAAIVVWQIARAPRSWTPEALPVAHRLPLALMATLPVSIWAFGLVAALATFSLLWVLQWENRRPKNMGASLAVAAAVAALTALYLDRFAVGRMPDAAVLTLF